MSGKYGINYQNHYGVGETWDPRSESYVADRSMWDLGGTDPATGKARALTQADAYRGQAAGYDAQAAAYGQDYRNTQAQQTANRQIVGEGYNKANANYAAMGQQVQALQDAAAGRGPSVAQVQQQQGVEQALAAQMAAAQSGPGFSPAAQAAAARQGAQMQRQAVGDAAALRAQEQIAAQGQLGQALGQQQAAAQGIAGLGMSQQQFDAGQQAMALGAQQQAAANGIQYQQMGNQLWLGQGQLGAQEQQFYGQQNAIQNQWEQDQMFRAQAAMQAERDRNSKFWGDMYGNFFSTGGQMMKSGLQSDERSKQRIRELDDANQALVQQLGGAPAVEPTYYKAQTDTGVGRQIATVSPTDAAAQVRPVTYEYTPEAQAADPQRTRQGRQAGVIAQQVEQTPLAPIVKQDPDGTRVLDVPAAASASLAVGADNARRIKAMEAKLYTQERATEDYSLNGEQIDEETKRLRAMREELAKARAVNEQLARAEAASAPTPSAEGYDAFEHDTGPQFRSLTYYPTARNPERL